jgi:cell wall-associated NlpC family hydrolase
MPRRASFIAFLGLVVALVFVTGISAGAAPDESVQAKEAEVMAAQERLMEIRLRVSAAQASYDNALYEMNHLNGQIARASRDLEAAKKRVAEAEENLEERASQVYKNGNLAFGNVLVGVNSFSEFAARPDLWMRLLGQDKAEVEAVREAENEFAARKNELEAQRRQRVEAVERAIAQKERATEAEAEAEAYLNSLNTDLRSALQARQERQAELASAAATQVGAEVPASASAAADEPEPIPEVEVSQATPIPVPQPDLEDEQAAAEREAAAQAAAAEAERRAAERAAERAAAREAAEQAEEEQIAAEREAVRLATQEGRQDARAEAERRAAERAAERAAARQAARREAERQAELAAERAAIEQAAAEQAAAEQAAAERAAARRAEEEQFTAERGAAERAAAKPVEERHAPRNRPPSASSADASSADASSADASVPSASATGASAPAAGAGGVGGSGGDVIAEGQKHLDTPYVLGGSAQCIAYKQEDCSCFTMLVYQEFGIALPDNPGAQMGYGRRVSGAPVEGDLLFWSEDGSGVITHVGIAMGDGTTIHASVLTGVVTQGTSINDISGYVGARRLL